MKKFIALESRTRSRSAFATALLCSVALGPLAMPVVVHAKPAVNPTHPMLLCSALAAWVEKEGGPVLNLNPFADVGGGTITAGTPVLASVVPASGNNLSYCKVVFQLKPAITIEVGLPLNALDGGTGAGCGLTTITNNTCVEGNWNGKIDAIGNGGYAGTVPGVTSATNVGFVGSSTDNGHSTNWCNAVNPSSVTNAEANCGVAGGGFELDPNNKLLTQQITDFIDTSEVDQTVWATKLTNAYYGQSPSRTYWTGCSTGGRQGMQMAQFHPELFDGILAGAPAFQWNRFIIGELWPLVVVGDVDPIACNSGTKQSCANGVSTAFANAYTAANAAAVAACDADDGVMDGVINEPRRCTFDARRLVNQTPAPMTVPMTEADARAINMIWDGPRNQKGERLWGGITRGTSFSTLTTPFSGSLISTYVVNWMEQNPNYDIMDNITTTNFASFFQMSDRKFADTTPPPPGFVVPAATDLVDLSGLIRRGTKLLHYRGSSDPLIVPFGSWNWDSRLFEKYGLPETERFYRSFYYPGNGHCGGNGGFPNAGLINTHDLFNALIGWVENDDAPNSVVSFTQANDAGNSTLICSNPQQTVYKGGPTTSASSYTCTNHDEEPADLAAFSETARQYHEDEAPDHSRP